MKRAVKYTLMISAIVSMCICCLFSIPVFAADYVVVNVPYTRTGWTCIQTYDTEMNYNDAQFFADFTNLRAYIEDGNPAGNENVDTSVPTYICADTSLHTNSNAIPMTTRCIPFDDLTAVDLNNNASTNEFLNVVNSLLGVNIPGNPYSVTSIDYRTLYQLGYRIHAYCQTNYSGGTCYVYVLNKMIGSDRINFLDTGVEIDGSLGGTEYHEGVYATFTRWDFNVMNMYDRSNNKVTFSTGSYVEASIGYLYMTSDLWRAAIYDYNDMAIELHKQYDNNNNWVGVTVDCYITGMNPYIITYYTNTLSGSMQNQGFLGGNMTCVYYPGAGSDLTSINQHLVTIEDLLEDLQVTEINNIYQDITNEYNVDIDLTLNNIIDDLSDNINSFDFTDENYQIPETDLQKISGFRLIFTNMIQTMNANGIGILWFLPLVLLVLGAII